MDAADIERSSIGNEVRSSRAEDVPRRQEDALLSLNLRHRQNDTGTRGKQESRYQPCLFRSSHVLVVGVRGYRICRSSGLSNERHRFRPAL